MNEIVWSAKVVSPTGTAAAAGTGTGAAGGGTAAGAAPADSDPTAALARRRTVEGLDAELARLRAEEDTLRQNIATYEQRLENVPARVRRLGDLWKPLLSSRGRFRLEEVH